MSKKVHVRISSDGAKYSYYANYCLLSFSIINEEYTLSSEGKWQHSYAQQSAIRIRVAIFSYRYTFSSGNQSAREL